MKKTPWRPPIPKQQRNYPMNCWWVAALSEEINENLSGRWLLDTPVLLYRKEDGEVAAIRDRCPHRAAPLSMGKRRGDNVECGYHGFIFSPNGNCVRVPSIQGDPPNFQIPSYPIIEQKPFIWIYLGDPDAIDSVTPPTKLDWYDDNNFATTQGRLAISANYMLLKENVLDLTHFGYVHASSFKITDWVKPPKIAKQGEHVGFSQQFIESPLPEVFAKPLGLPTGTPFNRNNHGYFITPALQMGYLDFVEPEKQSSSDIPFARLRLSHATTPIDNNSMLYFWVLGRDFGTSAEEMAELKRITEIGFAEDEVMLEAVQRTMQSDKNYSDKLEVSVQADGPHMQARRKLKKWMDADP